MEIRSHAAAAEIARHAPLREAFSSLPAEDRLARFRALGSTDAAELFQGMSTHEQLAFLRPLSPEDRRPLVRLLAPDDLVDLVQAAEPEERLALLALLEDYTRDEVSGLLAYAEDAAGGLMNPRFTSVRSDLTVDQALAYVRRQAREHRASTWYVYVLDNGRLVGVVSTRRLLASPPRLSVRDIMHRDLVTVPADLDQEALSRLFARHELMAIPVVDAQGLMKGIVTLDDIVDVVQEEATEDIQKFGGMEALERPYLDNPIVEMVRKRAGWLAVLFLGEMLTTTAMSSYEDEIQRAAILATFVPLIISSGGNSGSQASTLVIRALALQELRAGDVWRVCRRELLSGLALGVILGAIAFTRVVLGHAMFGSYPDHAGPLALTIAVSLLGVVLFGTLTGSMLPFALRRLGLDPASASAPFVATLVDVTGIIIYFTVATFFLAEMLG